MNEAERKEQGEYERRRAAMRSARAMRRRREMRLRTALVMFGVVLVLITGWQVSRFLKGKESKPAAKEVPIIKKIIAEPPDYDVQLLTVNEYSRPGSALERVNGVVVHYTANPGTTARQNRDYFERLGQSGATYASSHFVIGIEGELIQCIPCQEIAYASNDRNQDTIAIECCIPDETGKFSDATYGVLIHLLAWLMGRYDLEIDDIIRHYDITQKACPKYYVEYPSEWEELKKDVCQYIDAYGTAEEPSADAGR